MRATMPIFCMRDRSGEINDHLSLAFHRMSIETQIE